MRNTIILQSDVNGVWLVTINGQPAPFMFALDSIELSGKEIKTFKLEGKIYRKITEDIAAQPVPSVPSEITSLIRLT